MCCPLCSNRGIAKRIVSISPDTITDMTQEIEQIKKEIERRINSAIYDMASPRIEVVQRGMIRKQTLDSILSFIKEHY